MTLSMRHRFLFALSVAFALVYATWFLLATSRNAEASNYPGLPAAIASTSQIVVGQVVSAPIVATSSCSSRIISTTVQGVMLTMSDKTGQTPTGTFGYWQPASTTVAYDSGIYGCGAVKVFGGGGVSSNITVSDVQ